jgi:hypothetical protein
MPIGDATSSPQLREIMRRTPPRDGAARVTLGEIPVAVVPDEVSALHARPQEANLSGAKPLTPPQGQPMRECTSGHRASLRLHSSASHVPLHHTNLVYTIRDRKLRGVRAGGHGDREAGLSAFSVNPSLGRAPHTSGAKGMIRSPGVPRRMKNRVA